MFRSRYRGKLDFIIVLKFLISDLIGRMAIEYCDINYYYSKASYKFIGFESCVMRINALHDNLIFHELRKLIQFIGLL